MSLGPLEGEVGSRGPLVKGSCQAVERVGLVLFCHVLGDVEEFEVAAPPEEEATGVKEGLESRVVRDLEVVFYGWCISDDVYDGVYVAVLSQQGLDIALHPRAHDDGILGAAVEEVLQDIGLAAVVAGQAMFLLEDRGGEACHVLEGPLGIHDLAFHGAGGNDGQGGLSGATQAGEDQGGI